MKKYLLLAPINILYLIVTVYFQKNSLITVKYKNDKSNLVLMTQISPFMLPFVLSAIMSSTDYGSQTRHTVYGLVMDEKGNNVNGADVLIESTVDKRHITSSLDGSFFSDICVSGSFDEICIKANYGPKCGIEKISARRNHIAVDIVLH